MALLNRTKIYCATLPSGWASKTDAQKEAWLKDTTGTDKPTWSYVKNVQSIPAMGGTQEKVEVTCLDDTVRKYINGIKSYGESLDFGFLYDGTASTGNYAVLSALNSETAFKVEFDLDATNKHAFVFTGEPSVAFNDTADVSAFTFTLSVAPLTDIYYI